MLNICFDYSFRNNKVIINTNMITAEINYILYINEIIAIIVRDTE